MRQDDRFIRIYSKGIGNANEIWVDRETGVNYLFHVSGYAGGLTPLLDRDGKPVVTDAYTLEHEFGR
ncbi:MAG: DUF6440 family protein [Eubacteriales bacterium]|nr:DUF6440 family protein [Eubacteriales bacterium]